MALRPPKLLVERNGGVGGWAVTTSSCFPVVYLEAQGCGGCGGCEGSPSFTFHAIARNSGRKLALVAPTPPGDPFTYVVILIVILHLVPLG
jgi:hypothetical protein